MRVLLTNDDGITASGLAKLAEIASQFADEVYVVAPAGQRSAISHGISVRDPLYVEKVEYPIAVTAAYSCSGTPADCVKVAINAILKEKPDYVLSGINRGYNMGFDTVYSGTVGAARDAIYQGVKAFAISTYEENFQLVDCYLKDILLNLMEKEIGTHELWNINFPACDQEQYAGIKETIPASYSYYLDTYEKKEEGENSWTYTLIDTVNDRIEENSDFHAINQGYISVEKLYCSVLKTENK